MYNHVHPMHEDATPSTSTTQTITDRRSPVPRQHMKQQRLFLQPTLAVANTTANIARSSCRVNVPCATPCSSSLPLPTYSRGRRVLCGGASRRENGRRRGDLDGKSALNAVELAHARGRTREKADRTKKAEQSRDGMRRQKIG
jgi:hypothetical protein